MRIVLYANSYLPHVGGRELVIHHLAKALIALGHDVRVVGPAGWWGYRDIKFEYPVHRFPVLTRKSCDTIRLMQLYADVWWRGCDVIHAHITYPCGYIAARLKRFMDAPLVITPHGADIHVIPEIGHGLRRNPMIAGKIRYALAGADAITAISDSVVTSLLEAGAPVDRIIKVPNGVDGKRFEGMGGGDVYEWLQIPRTSKILVAVGNYNARKGHEVLVKAMPRVLQFEPEARLIIVGRNNEQALSSLIDALQLHGKVICTGQLPPPALTVQDRHSSNREPDWLTRLYQTAKAYLSAGISEGSEGLSLALLEAMAAELPVIASNVSGNRDVIIERENGVLVDPGNPAALARAIIDVLGDEPSRSCMGKNGGVFAAAFQWETIAKQYIQVYQAARERVRRGAIAVT